MPQEERVQQLVVLGDARHMERVPDGSVHLVVTSPPYWQLKDYGSPEQIGFHQTYEEYVDSLNAVWAECVRVLHPGCRMAVNIGDQFTRAATYGRYKVLPIRETIVRFLESNGLDAMGAIIWQKVTTCNTSGGGVVMGSYPYPRNGIIKVDYEFILIFKKPGDAPRPTVSRKEKARMSLKEWNTYFYGHWNLPGVRQEDHIAVFPLEVPRRLIKMFTFPGETVLDPFVGSGTTLKAAQELGRSGIGYEINEEFLPVIQRKVGEGGQRDLFKPPVRLIIQRAASGSESRAPATPPGRSASSRRMGGGFDRLEAADSGGYGSVVRRGDSRHREKYRRVVDVRDLRTVVLDDGETVKLLGVKANRRSPGAGVERLRELTSAASVFLREDPGATSDDIREVYLYLRNRTFINARLVREGFADADRTRAYRHRRRFERYEREREAGGEN